MAAIVFARAINQLVELLQHRLNIKRKVAIAISVTGVLIFAIGFIALVIPLFIDRVQELVTLIAKGLEQLSSWNKWLQNLLPGNLIEDVRGLKSLTQNIKSFGIVFSFTDYCRCPSLAQRSYSQRCFGPLTNKSRFK